MWWLLVMSYSNAAGASNDQSIIEQLFNNIIDSQIWNLGDTGINTTPDPLDRLGEALSHGDYNDDGYQDLAIGIPNYDFEFFEIVNNIGAVLILYGGPNGLSTNINEQLLFQTFESDPPNLENLNGIEANDQFGQTLASGDFNCDGITDLAVGTPEESVIISGEDRDAVGAINIFYGSVNGFTEFGAGSTFLFQGTDAVSGNFSDFVSAGDRFGWSMAVGNFNGDVENGNRCMDLAVSAPFENFGMETTETR